MANQYEYDDFPNDSPGFVAKQAAHQLWLDGCMELSEGATVEDVLADIDAVVTHLKRWESACRRAGKVLRVVAP